MGKKRHRTRPAPQAPARAVRSPLATARAFVTFMLPVIAVSVVTRVALAETYHIPSGSMEPTLQVGDWLVVNKLRYGPHVPFTNVNLPGYAAPRTGEVVVFVSPPQDPSIRISSDEITPTLVKRIVGTAGDTLTMRGGRLTRNGVPQASPASDVAPAPAAFATEPLPIFVWQRRIEVASSRFGTPPAQPTLHDWGPLVVPRGTYFMMGDNRDNSVDSRFYGPVPRENVRGAPLFIYYSYDPEEGVEYVRALTAIRWSRLGTRIR